MQASRGLWQDEATLLANFRLPWTAYFHSLPFYDQAGPPAALLTLNGAWLATGGSIIGTRILLLSFHVVIMAGIAWQAFNRRDEPVLLAIAMMAVTPLFVRYTVEFKQYGFELQAAFVFIVALRWFPARPVAVMVAAGCLSLFSYSMMLVVGVSVLDAVLFRFRTAVGIRWLKALIIYSLGWIACYLLLFAPATALQSRNYPTAYQRLSLSAYLHDPMRLEAQLGVIPRAQAGVVLLCASVAIIGLLLARRGLPRLSIPAIRHETWQPLRVLLGLIALTLLLWLARLYPISSNKQFLFTMPITALAMSEIFFAVCVPGKPRRVWAICIALALTLIPSSVITLSREWTKRTDFQDTLGLYAYLKRQPEALVLPDVFFEPTLRLYMAQDPNPPAQVAGLLASTSRPMEPPQRLVAMLRNRDRQIPQHLWEQLYTYDFYPEYARWLVRHAAGKGPAIVAATRLSDDNERAYLNAARQQGCQAAIRFRSREVLAIQLDCPPSQS